MSRAWSLGIYKALMGAAEPMAPGLLRRRAGRGKEDIARLSERLGVASRAELLLKCIPVYNFLPRLTNPDA